MKALSSRLALVLIACLPAAAAVQPGHQASPPPLTPHRVTLASGRTFTLRLPAEFDISVVAQGLGRVRFLAQSPDGRIFVTDMHDLADNTQGAIYILDGFDAKTGRIRRVVPYLTHLRNPNDLAFYTDAAGQQWLYLPLTDRLLRYRYRAGDMTPSGEPEVLARYPDYGLNYKYGGWHLTRTVAFAREDGRDKLYVSVGSSCNNCEEKEEIRATLSVMDPDGKNARILARGLRNAVGLRYVGGTLYGTNMGADHLGPDAPDDTMFALDHDQTNNRSNDQTGSSTARNYGWPYCYYDHGKGLDDPVFGHSSRNPGCAALPLPYTVFAAHSAPLGLEYFDASAQSATLRDSFLVALHGPVKLPTDRGYRVVSVRPGQPPQDFLTGFLRGTTVNGRPCGLLRVGPDAFLLTDDHRGVIYYIRRSVR